MTNQQILDAYIDKLDKISEQGKIKIDGIFKEYSERDNGISLVIDHCQPILNEFSSKYSFSFPQEFAGADIRLKYYSLIKSNEVYMELSNYFKELLESFVKSKLDILED